MSQKEWAEYFLKLGSTKENTNIGWSPGEESGRRSPIEVKEYFNVVQSRPSSVRGLQNILSTSYKSAGKVNKTSRRRRNTTVSRRRKSRRNSKLSRRSRRN